MINVLGFWHLLVLMILFVYVKSMTMTQQLYFGALLPGNLSSFPLAINRHATRIWLWLS